MLQKPNFYLEMNREQYNNAGSYETFLARAFKYDNRFSNPSNQELINLIETENGQKFSFLPSREKQFESIRKRMSKAILLLASQKLPRENVQGLKFLLSKLEVANSSNDIIEIVKLGLDYSRPLIGK